MNASEISPKANARLNRIKSVSTIVGYILFAGLVFWTAVGIATIFTLIVDLCLWKQMGASATLYLKAGVIIGILIIFVVNFCLFRFFDRLKAGYLFDAQTVRKLDAADKWCMVLWLFSLCFHVIGHSMFQSTVPSGWNSGGLFPGLVLIFVAWLLREAQELQEEQKLTV